MGKFVCSVCGYVYNPVMGDRSNGVAAGTSFDKIPENWVCPVCGKNKNNFSQEK